jgi:hypothetical protein
MLFAWETVVLKPSQSPAGESCETLRPCASRKPRTAVALSLVGAKYWLT